MDERRIPAVLAVAGSDSGGGAGVQADLKAFAAAGVHGMTAVTAITAQNTLGVDAIHQVPGDVIIAQVRAVATDIGVDAVKVGMLGSAETAWAVVDALALIPGVPVVVDPVMVSESGAALLEPGAREVLLSSILPLATVLTPNLPEARALTGAGDEVPAVELAAMVRALGPAAVIVTGGHASGADVLDDGSGELLEFSGEMHPDGAAHGSGCTHSSFLAAMLALGHPLRTAAALAREMAGQAIGNGLRAIGSGPGPVDALDVASNSQAWVEVLRKP